MADTRRNPVLNYLRQVFGTSADAGVADADLLRRFVAERDEAAFELLLWRHAAMVLHVCRQVLADAQEVEDAFQATFLVFVRKAGSISRREALGSWLYRVAYRIALKARGQLKKQPATHAEMDSMAAPTDTDDAGQRELRRMVCEEVNRLPAKYRAPIVACFFEGKTHEEAAQQLGWPRGTVAGRLSRARELLRRRLVRRGVTLPAGTLVTALSARTSRAALTGLIDSTIQIAKRFAAGESAAALTPRAANLAEGVLQTMSWTRIKIGAVVMLLVGFGGAGATVWATQRKGAERPEEAAPSAGEARAADSRPAGDKEAISREDAAEVARNMARSRLNLKALALAMQNYNDTMSHLPPAATTDKNGKALLSWRVELLPFLEEGALYNQFKHDEPWDSPHNKKLLSKMPAIYAPPGVKTRQSFSTFYQVFVSPGSPGKAVQQIGIAGPWPQGSPPPGGVPPGSPTGGAFPGIGITSPPTGKPMEPKAALSPMTAFVKGQTTHIPASFPDGTCNTILIVEAGNPVPWTKPEDLRYAEDEPLPELGGLFSDVFHAALADGTVHTLTKKYDEKQLRYAITANDGEVIDWAKIQGRSRYTAGQPDGDRSAIEDLQRKNAALQRELEQAHERIRQLKEEREVQRELAAEDPGIEQLKTNHERLQAELKKMRAEMEALDAEIHRLQRPRSKKGP